MAKSTGNFILPEQMFTGENDILNKAFAPTVVKFFMYQAHYRSILDFSNDALEASERGFNRLMDAYRLLEELPVSETNSVNIADWRKKCYEAMNDDFNSPILIAHLFDAVRFIHSIQEKKDTITSENLNLLKTTLHDFLFEVLGLIDETQEQSVDGEKLTATIELLIELRNKARADKDFETSDRIRDILTEKGIHLKDGKDGTTFSLN